jgi:hypothetical protein
LRKARPTLSDIPPSARIDPHTEKHLRAFWQEVDSDAVYAVGNPELEGSSCITPIDLYVRRSAIRAPEYHSSMNLIITFAEQADIREGRFVSSPPPKRGSGELPSVKVPPSAAADKANLGPPELVPERAKELRFLFARLENVGMGADAHGLFHKRLWVWGAVPIASTLQLRDELKLIISCRQLSDLDSLFLRPAPPQIAVH